MRYAELGEKMQLRSIDGKLVIFSLDKAELVGLYEYQWISVEVPPSVQLDLQLPRQEEMPMEFVMVPVQGMDGVFPGFRYYDRQGQEKTVSLAELSPGLCFSAQLEPEQSFEDWFKSAMDQRRSAPALPPRREEKR